MAIILDPTNGITNVNGTAAVPAITGTDTDTGLYFGTNTLGLSTAGTAAITVDTSQNTTFVGAINTPNTFGFKNRIINGAMMIDQRNAGASYTTTSGTQYSLDRWYSYNSQASKYTIQQSSTAPANFSNSLKVTVAASSYTPAASEIFDIEQRIEGFNFADMAWGTANAKTITISFWVYSSLTGTFGGALENSAADRSYPFTYTISAANTWEQKTITIAGDTSGTWVGATNGIGLKVCWSIGTGSTYTGPANAWAATTYVSATGATNILGTANATWYITGVQLEKGSLATSFDYRPYGTELALCQRYCVLYAQATASTQELIGAGAAWASNNYWCAIRLPVPMRSTPTLSVTTGTNYYSFQSGGVTAYSTTLTDPGYYGSANLGQMVYQTGLSGLTSGWGLICSAYTNGAKVLYSAEL